MGLHRWELGGGQVEGVLGQSTWCLFVSIETISQSSGPHASLLKGLDDRRWGQVDEGMETEKGLP